MYIGYVCKFQYGELSLRVFLPSTWTNRKQSTMPSGKANDTGSIMNRAENSKKGFADAKPLEIFKMRGICELTDDILGDRPECSSGGTCNDSQISCNIQNDCIRCSSWYIIYIYANITPFLIRYYENCEYAAQTRSAFRWKFRSLFMSRSTDNRILILDWYDYYYDYYQSNKFGKILIPRLK